MVVLVEDAVSRRCAEGVFTSLMPAILVEPSLYAVDPGTEPIRRDTDADADGETSFCSSIMNLKSCDGLRTVDSPDAKFKLMPSLR
jgi:hypothetical protein